MEITHGSGGYHPHLHILLDCPWLTVHTKPPAPWMPPVMRKELTEQAQRELTNAWARCIDQDSAIVWVKRATKGTEVEVLKYSIAPADLIAMGDGAAECILAMTGVRLVVAWGSCYGQVKKWETEDKRDTPPSVDACCTSPSWMPDSVVMHIAGRALEAAPEKIKREQQVKNLEATKRVMTKPPLERKSDEYHRSVPSPSIKATQIVVVRSGLPHEPRRKP
jgi:hypothetical protein